jgi:hypothetical protein
MKIKGTNTTLMGTNSSQWAANGLAETLFRGLQREAPSRSRSHFHLPQAEGGALAGVEHFHDTEQRSERSEVALQREGAHKAAELVLCWLLLISNLKMKVVRVTLIRIS